MNKANPRTTEARRCGWMHGEARPGLGGALSRLLGAGQEINCEEEIGNIEREATLLHLAYAHGIKLNYD